MFGDVESQKVIFRGKSSVCIAPVNKIVNGEILFFDEFGKTVFNLVSKLAFASQRFPKVAGVYGFPCFSSDYGFFNPDKFFHDVFLSDYELTMGEKAAIVTSDPCQRREEAVYSHTALIVNL